VGDETYDGCTAVASWNFIYKFFGSVAKIFLLYFPKWGNPHKNVSERCPIPFGDCSTGNYCHQAHDLIFKKLYII
jgi:hypothetical protein